MHKGGGGRSRNDHLITFFSFFSGRIKKTSLYILSLILGSDIYLHGHYHLLICGYDELKLSFWRLKCKLQIYHMEYSMWSLYHTTWSTPYGRFLVPYGVL